MKFNIIKKIIIGLTDLHKTYLRSISINSAVKEKKTTSKSVTDVKD